MEKLKKLLEGNVKKSVTPQEAIDLLNSMLKEDKAATQELFSARAVCNEGLANHPTIQVRKYKKEDIPTVGILGVLNGLFGVNEKGYGAITMVMDHTTITKFQLTK